MSIPIFAVVAIIAMAGPAIAAVVLAVQLQRRSQV